MKTIYHVYTDIYGEYDFFFDDKGKRLCHWHLNDAHWRSEYMDPLLKALKIKVLEGKPDDARWKDKIYKILSDDGASEDDLT